MQLGLHRRAQDGAAGEQEPEGGQVVAGAVELVEQRSGEGVAHDQQRADLLPLAGGEHVGGVEAVGAVLHDHRAAGHPAADGVPVGGAVHERGSGQHPQPAAAPGGVAGQLGQILVLGAVAPSGSQGGDQEVRLAPQHALGVAGGATRVDHVQVVARPVHVGSLGGRRRQRLLVVERPRQQVVAGTVVDPQQQLDRPHLVEHRRQRLREAAVVDDGAGAGVAEHVGELVGHVPVVDVERCRRRLVRAEHALEVLVAVEQVERDRSCGDSQPSQSDSGRRRPRPCSPSRLARRRVRSVTCAHV